FIVGGPVGDFELLLCHGTVCVVGKMRDLILQLSKSSIYSTKPYLTSRPHPALIRLNHDISFSVRNPDTTRRTGHFFMVTPFFSLQK
ncbi:hypothetical protein ACVFZB_24495, partial [Escherichia coli]